jgi:hypothetical protein
MSWLAVVPIVLASAAWLILPGLPVGYLLGLRGVAAWASAPVISIALIGLTAVLAEKLSVGWSPAVPIAVAVVVGAAAGVVAFLLRQRFTARERDGRAVAAGAAAGLLGALVLGAIVVVNGLGRPDNLSQTYDALFHYNTVALILDTHRASSLTVANFGTPGTAASFYPAAWHDVVALVVTTTGTGIPVAANLVSAVVAAVLWPLSCVFLARQVFGRSPAALAVTGVLSVGFAAGPWGLLGFGVLWPNALGMATLPAGLAGLLSLTGLARDDALGKGRAAVLLALALVAATFAHPGALFGLIVLGLFPVGHALLRRTARLHRAGRTGRGAAEVLAVIVVLGAAWYWTATTHNPTFENARLIHWPAFETPSAAIGEVLLNGTNGRPALWLLSAVVLVGLLATLRVTERRWLVPAHAATGFLFVVAASLNQPETRKFTGYWYNDSYRLAAMLPVTAVPLATSGILFLAGKIAAARIPDATQSRIPPWLARLAGSATVLALVLVALLAAITKGLYVPDRTDRLAVPYLRPPPGDVLASAGQRDFLIRAGQRIPQDAVVANNPWDGSGMLWALADRRTLFPHFTAPADADRLYLAAHLSDVATDPAVCQAAQRLRVSYLLIGDADFWPGDPRRQNYPGFVDPHTRSGFQLVMFEGGRKLYRITGCATDVRTP